MNGLMGSWTVLGAVLSSSQRFGVYLAGAALANLARWFLVLAASVLVFDLTGSTFVVGLVSIALFLPTMVFAAVAGKIADQWSCRRIVAVTNGATAALVAILAIAVLTERISVFLVVALMLGVGILNAFQAPAVMSLVLELVDPAERDVALSMNAMQFNLGRVLGPVIGTAFIAQIGLGPGLLANCLLIIVFLVSLMFLRPVVRVRPPGPVAMAPAIKHLRQDQHAVWLLAIAAISSGSSDVVSTIAPALSEELTGESARAGYLLSAFGLGAVVFALALQPVLRHLRRQLTLFLLMQGIGTIILGLAPSLSWAIAGSAISGAGFLATSARTSVLLQGSVPPEMIGRVLAVWTVAVLGFRPLFSVMSGLVSDLWNPRAAALLSAAGLVTMGLIFWARQWFRVHRASRGQDTG